MLKTQKKLFLDPNYSQKIRSIFSFIKFQINFFNPPIAYSKIPRNVIRVAFSALQTLRENLSPSKVPHRWEFRNAHSQTIDFIRFDDLLCFQASRIS